MLPVTVRSSSVNLQSAVGFVRADAYSIRPYTVEARVGQRSKVRGQDIPAGAHQRHHIGPYAVRHHAGLLEDIRIAGVTLERHPREGVALGNGKDAKERIHFRRADVRAVAAGRVVDGGEVHDAPTTAGI